MNWIVLKKISVEALKDTRPEKELSSDSEDASEEDGIASFLFFNLVFTQPFLSQILIPMPARRARTHLNPAPRLPQTKTLILKMTKITKLMTNLQAVEAHLQGKHTLVQH
jgi:hypothetical protein